MYMYYFVNSKQYCLQILVKNDAVSYIWKWSWWICLLIDQRKIQNGKSRPSLIPQVNNIC